MNFLLNYETRFKELGMELSFKSAFYAIITSISLIGFVVLIMFYLNISLIDIIGFGFPYCIRLTISFFAIIALHLASLFCASLTVYVKSIGYDDDNDLDYNIDELNIALDKFLEVVLLLQDFIQATRFYNDIYQLIIYIGIISNTCEICCSVIICYLGNWNGTQLQVFLILYIPGYCMYFGFYLLCEVLNVRVCFFNLIV